MLLKACDGSELMHVFWDQHLKLTRNVGIALRNQGMLLNQMNIALTVLATDLLAHELKASALLSSRT